VHDLSHRGRCCCILEFLKRPFRVRCTLSSHRDGDQGLQQGPDLQPKQPIERFEPAGRRVQLHPRLEAGLGEVPCPDERSDKTVHLLHHSPLWRRQVFDPSAWWEVEQPKRLREMVLDDVLHGRLCAGERCTHFPAGSCWIGQGLQALDSRTQIGRQLLEMKRQLLDEWIHVELSLIGAISR